MRENDFKLKSKEEEREITGQIQDMCYDFYSYMHNPDRDEPVEPQTLLKYMLPLFDGDWIGLIDFDLAVGAWSAKYFYNANTKSTKKTLIQEAECIEQAAGWVEAIRKNEPIIIEDIEDIRESSPEEYEMYKRLKVKSVLGVPYRNCSSGLLVVRNPKRLKTNYEILNLMSYIVTNELIAMRIRKNLARKAMPYTPKSSNEVYIKLLGEMLIVGKDLEITDEEILDPMKFLLAFMAENRNRAFCLQQLTDKFGYNDNFWKTNIYRFRKLWKSAAHIDKDEDQLLITMERGYMLNPKFEIVLDTDCAMQLTKAIEDATDINSKIELMKKYKALYSGTYLATLKNEYDREDDKRTRYKQMFADKMNMFMRTMFDQGKYEALAGYSADILDVIPHSADAHCWRVVAFRMLGQADIAKATMDLAKKKLDEEEYAYLCEKINGVVYVDQQVVDLRRGVQFNVYKRNAKDNYAGPKPLKWCRI